MKTTVRNGFYQASCFVLCTLAMNMAAMAVAQNERIAGIGPTGPIKELPGEYQFTEGPAADDQGQVYFTDIPANRIYKAESKENVSVFLEPSGHANGLMFMANGDLAACQMDGQVVAISPKTKDVRVLAGEYEGNRFNAPNDLVIDRTGGIYFTDPHFRAPMPLPQDKLGVYYISPDRQVTRLIDDLKAPNGVILSPDEKTLYVVPSLQEEVMAYPVESPGKIGEGRVFARLKQPEGRSGTGGDGLTVDRRGNLYITSALGLQVFDPQGQLLGIIEFPEQPSNATFGGPDYKTLYVTARTSVYTAPMEAQGHVFGGGEAAPGDQQQQTSGQQ